MVGAMQEEGEEGCRWVRGWVGERELERQGTHPPTPPIQQQLIQTASFSSIHPATHPLAHSNRLILLYPPTHPPTYLPIA